MTTKYLSVSKETRKLLINIRIILSSNKIQVLQKQELFNYFAEDLNNKRYLCKTKEFYFHILNPLSKDMRNMHSSLGNQIAHIFTCQ